MNRRDFLKASLTTGAMMATPFSKVLGPYANMYVSRNYRAPFVVPNEV